MVYTMAILSKNFGFGGHGWAAAPGAGNIDAIEREARRIGGEIAENGYTGEVFVKEIDVKSAAAVKRAGAEYLREFIQSIHDAAAVLRARGV